MIDKKKIRFSQLILNLVLIVLCLLIIAPFVLLVCISISKEADIIKYGYQYIPKNLDFSAYKYVFKYPKSILNAYKITSISASITMIFSVLLMSLVAYPLTKEGLNGRRGISFYLYFTMLFNGGLVPSYILITQYLHLDDTIWVHILPALINPWYVFMLRTFFSELPKEITESAYIDGANEYIILFRIILPLSKPVLATVGLFMFLFKWNDWYMSMLYIKNDSLISLQYFLQRIMLNIQLLQSSETNVLSMVNANEIPSETARMAMAVVVAGPALIVFPFFQKYFVKGLTVGGVKG